MSTSSDIAAQRLAEAAQIDQEWNAMSYKDRAAWWISAKWYGYQSTEAYRRGDAPNPNESCRYGEPGFFIATRVPYYDAQAAVSTITANDTIPAPAESTTTVGSTEAAPAPAEPTTAVVEATEPVPVISAKPVAEELEPPAVIDPTGEAANIVRTAAESGKKKKKKHHNNGNGGKTIQISLKH